MDDFFEVFTKKEEVTQYKNGAVKTEQYFYNNEGKINYFESVLKSEDEHEILIHKRNESKKDEIYIYNDHVILEIVENHTPKNYYKCLEHVSTIEDSIIGEL